MRASERGERRSITAKPFTLWYAIAACMLLACCSAKLLAEEKHSDVALDKEKTTLEAQRNKISAKILKAEEQAKQERLRQLAEEKEILEPPGLMIAVPPAPEGAELYTIQAEKVRFKSVLLCLARRAGFTVAFGANVDNGVLAEPVSTDLRLVALDDALDVLTGIVGLRYRTGREEKGRMQVLIFRDNLSDREEAVHVLRRNAVDIYTRLLLNYPEDDMAVVAYFHAGEIHFDEGEYGLAAQDYKLALDRDTGGKFSSSALLKLGKSYSNLGDYASASKAFYSSLDRAPGPEEACESLLALARAAAEAGEANEALGAYRRLLLEYPTAEAAVPALHELADLLFEQGEYHNALRQYELLRKQHPNYSERLMRYRVGSCKMMQQQWAAASFDFAKVLATGKRDKIAAQCYYGLAKCLDEAGGRLEALEVYMGAVEKFPGDPAAPRARARVVELYRSIGLLDKGMKYGEYSLKLIPPGTPGERIVTYQHAVTLLEAEAFERAMVLFEELAQAASAEVSKVDALSYAADAAQKLSKFERSEVLYRGALQAGPNEQQQQRALLGLGDSYLARGKYENAALAYQGIDPAEKNK